MYTSSISPSSPSSFYHSPSVLSILLFIFLPSCPLPHSCQLCLPALSKLELFSLALRKIALSLKNVFPILSSCLLIRSHSMFMLALVITIIIVDTPFRPHLTNMSSTIYMYWSVHKKTPIKIGEREKLVWGEKWVCVNTYLVFWGWGGGGNLRMHSFFRGENWVYTHFSGGQMSMGEHEYVSPVLHTLICRSYILLYAGPIYSCAPVIYTGYGA